MQSTVYPPPTPTLIDKVLYQMSLHRLVLLLQNGAICVYKVYQRETATLQLMQSASALKSGDGRPLAQTTFTTVLATSIVPPHYDCDQHYDGVRDLPDRPRRKTPLKRPESPQSEDLDLHSGLDANDNFLVFGLSKGHVIFVRIDIMDYIYARFAIHRQPVTQVAQLRTQQLFLSMCSEFSLKLWGFADNSL